MKVSIDGGAPVKLQEGTSFNRLSPDGRYFVGWNQPEDTATEQIQFAIFPADNSEPIRRIKAPADAGHIEWSPDGRAIDFNATRGVTNVYRLPVDGGPENRSRNGRRTRRSTGLTGHPTASASRSCATTRRLTSS